MTCGDLIDRHTTAVGDIASAREDRRQPGLFRVAVRRAAFPALVAETADHRQVFTQRFERLQDEWEVDIMADLLGLPFSWKSTVRGGDETQAQRRGCGGLGESCTCWDHCVEQREAYRRAYAFEHCSS